MFYYEMKLRPPSIGCQPKGFKEINHSKGAHGVLGYEWELDATELLEYDLAVWEGESE